MSDGISKQTLTIFRKEIICEYRSRSAISALLLFIANSIILISLSINGTSADAELAAGLYVLSVFFSSMISLSKSFSSEEERGTTLLLRIYFSSTAILFGKLLFNIVISLLINIVTIVLFSIFLSAGAFSLNFTLIFSIIAFSVAMASATTIISAIVAKSGSRNVLFPVLAFPVLLPLCFAGISLFSGLSNDSRSMLNGLISSEAFSDLKIILAYCGIMICVSYLLFDYLWRD